MLEDLERRLRRRAVFTDTSTDYRQAARALVTFDYDVVVLEDDARHSAHVLLGSLRTRKDETPVLLITDRALEAFSGGADDCIAAEFAPEELVARVLALSRRKPPPEPLETRVGDLILDARRQVVRRENHEAKLTATEFRLLGVLAQHAGSLVDHETLVRLCWGTNGHVPPNTVAAHVRSIRRKLGPPELVLCARTHGYFLWLEPGTPAPSDRPQWCGSNQPLELAILDLLESQRRAKTSAEVAADLERQGLWIAAGDPTEAVHALLLTLRRRGLVQCFGDKSRPRFKIVEVRATASASSPG